ncbi:uncharacterized protein LOC133834412 [Humulus lupulus]|uniref:uncharacterized protein LOC133834412 n=1 Tax=Humulus lupulus TaxID=3486 RepID=UPI002B4145D1|nr:uncharacterized protein LOC133834412 [Humulus lupulus]
MTSNTVPLPAPAVAINDTSFPTAAFSPVVFSHKISVKLDDNNFLLWRPQVWSAIKGHDLDDYIDSAVIPPKKFLTDSDAQTGAINPLYKQWVNTRSTSIFLVALLYVQRRAYTSCWKLNFSSYLEHIGDRLGSVGHVVSVKEHIVAIFKGRPPEYNTFVISINSRNQPYTVAEIKSLLLSQEHRMDIHNRPIDSVNLTTQRGFRGRGSSSSIHESRPSTSTLSNSSSLGRSTGRGSWNPYAVASCTSCSSGFS